MNVAVAVIAAFVAALVITAVSGFVLIPWLRQFQFGLPVSYADKKLYGKGNIPTAGGIMLALGTVSAVLITVLTDKLMGGDIAASGSLVPQEMYTKLWSGVITALAFGFIGFIDDYFRIATNGNSGLTVKQKSLLLILTAVAYLTSLYMGMQGAPFMFVPFIGNVETGFFYWIFGIVFIYCAVNSADATNGVDGLSSGISATAAISLGVIAALKGFFGFSALSAALAGACIGFLIWNKSPAKIHTGKTGSLFLGGMTVALAYALNSPLILLLSCISYFIEGASVAAQIVYFKATGGKLLLRTAPLHRHMEMCGKTHKKISLTLTVINILGAASAVAVMYYGGYILR